MNAFLPLSLRTRRRRVWQSQTMASTTTSAEHREKVSLRSFRVGLLADFNGVSLLPCILDCRFCTGLPIWVFKHPVVNSTRWQSQLAPFSTHLLGYLNVPLNYSTNSKAQPHPLSPLISPFYKGRLRGILKSPLIPLSLGRRGGEEERGTDAPLRHLEANELSEYVPALLAFLS